MFYTEWLCHSDYLHKQEAIQLVDKLAQYHTEYKVKFPISLASALSLYILQETLFLTEISSCAIVVSIVWY